MTQQTMNDLKNSLSFSIVLIFGDGSVINVNKLHGRITVELSNGFNDIDNVTMTYDELAALVDMALVVRLKSITFDSEQKWADMSKIYWVESYFNFNGQVHVKVYYPYSGEIAYYLHSANDVANRIHSTSVKVLMSVKTPYRVTYVGGY